MSSEFPEVVNWSLQDFFQNSVKEEDRRRAFEGTLVILSTQSGKSVICQLIPKTSNTSVVDAVVVSYLEHICYNINFILLFWSLQ